MVLVTCIQSSQSTDRGCGTFLILSVQWLNDKFTKIQSCICIQNILVNFCVWFTHAMLVNSFSDECSAYVNSFSLTKKLCKRGMHTSNVNHWKFGLPCKKISVSAASHQIAVKTKLNIEDWKLWTLDFNCCWLLIHHNNCPSTATNRGTQFCLIL
jgi:hypothetical protein